MDSQNLVLIPNMNKVCCNLKYQKLFLRRSVYSVLVISASITFVLLSLQGSQRRSQYHLTPTTPASFMLMKLLLKLTAE